MDFKSSDERPVTLASTNAAGRRLIACRSVNGTGTTAMPPPTNPAKDHVKPGVSENTTNLVLTTKCWE